METEEGINDTFSILLTDDTCLLNMDFTGIIYFGRDTCDFCRSMNVYLSKICKDNKDIVLYKYDTDFWRNSQSFHQILMQYQIEQIPAILKVDKYGNITQLSIKEEDEDIYSIISDFLIQ